MDRTHLPLSGNLPCKSVRCLWPRDLGALITQHFAQLTDADTRLLKVLYRRSGPASAIETAKKSRARWRHEPHRRVLSGTRRLGSGISRVSYLSSDKPLLKERASFADPTARMRRGWGARAPVRVFVSLDCEREIAALEHCAIMCPMRNCVLFASVAEGAAHFP